MNEFLRSSKCERLTLQEYRPREEVKTRMRARSVATMGIEIRI